MLAAYIYSSEKVHLTIYLSQFGKEQNHYLVQILTFFGVSMLIFSSINNKKMKKARFDQHLNH